MLFFQKFQSVALGQIIYISYSVQQFRKSAQRLGMYYVILSDLFEEKTQIFRDTCYTHTHVLETILHEKLDYIQDKLHC